MTDKINYDELELPNYVNNFCIFYMLNIKKNSFINISLLSSSCVDFQKSTTKSLSSESVIY